MRNTSGWYGGDICCWRDSPATITENIIIGNEAAEGWNGGGMYIQGAPIVANNVVANNSATNGAGLSIRQSSTLVEINNMTIANNTSSSHGGGIYAYNFADLTLSDSIVWGNSAEHGNQVAVLAGSRLAFSYCDVQEQSAGAHVSSGAELTYADGCLEEAPLFADPDNGDYHLKSAAGRYAPDANDGEGGWVTDEETSACIDAGSPDAEWDKEPMPNFARVNMGAFGNTKEASKSPRGLAGDFNGDCTVNMLDLIYVRNRLGAKNTSVAELDGDVNGDGKINILDLIFVRGRLGTKCP
jgi:hypothetical protein